MDKRTKVIAVGAVALAGLGIGGGVAVAANGGNDDASISGDAADRATEAALAHTGGGRVTETEAGDEDSYYEVEVTLDDGTQIDVQLDRDFAVVGSDRDDDSGRDDDGREVPLTGAELEQASAAAIAHTGGGRVTEADTGDDGAAYEVEVTRDDGTQVEIDLDASFAVVGTDTDDNGPDDDGPDDDRPDDD